MWNNPNNVKTNIESILCFTLQYSGKSDKFHHFHHFEFHQLFFTLEYHVSTWVLKVRTIKIYAEKSRVYTVYSTFTFKHRCGHRVWGT